MTDQIQADFPEYWRYMQPLKIYFNYVKDKHTLIRWIAQRLSLQLKKKLVNPLELPGFLN